MVGGLRAFVRTYQTWRNHETWWAWQGAGWFLLTLMLLVLTMSMPALAGPAVFGVFVDRGGRAKRGVSDGVVCGEQYPPYQ